MRNIVQRNRNLYPQSLRCSGGTLLFGIALVCLAFTMGVIRYHNSGVVVTTSCSTRGRLVTTRHGAHVQLFLDVPYGETTAGKARFAKPRPLERPPYMRGIWEELSPAGSPCVQRRLDGTIMGSEDCLYMNVWAPVVKPQGNRNWTIVVVVTGDSFQRGQSYNHGWAELAAAGNFVVAVPNHRQGVFGFLNAGAGRAVGNAAIEDILLALSWLKRNAREFNGDANNIAALGHGSGAYLLSVVLMSPEYNVFKRAILQGPYPTVPFTPNTPDRGRSYLAEMALSLNCTNADDVYGRLECLRNATKGEVMRSAMNLTEELPFTPSPFYGVPLAELHKRAPFGDYQQVVLGSDRAEAEAVFKRFAASTPQAYDENATSVEAVFQMFVERLRAKNLTDGETVPWAVKDMKSAAELEDYVVRYWTICFPNMIADAAVAKNATVYRYVSTPSGGQLFWPLFDVASMARFFRNGTVPSTSSDEPWPPYGARAPFILDAANASGVVFNADVDCVDKRSLLDLFS